MAERPVECGHCKRGVKVVYKEIVSDVITETEMCAECPILQQKLHGSAPKAGNGITQKDAGLCCGNCGTSLETVQTGNTLGCSECYTVFENVLIAQLLTSDQIYPRLKAEALIKKSQPLHIGATPHAPSTIASSSHIMALSEALNEALKKENYEQAAWLRDQIKALREKPDDGKK
jgi:protein arginine kinase activator